MEMLLPSADRSRHSDGATSAGKADQCEIEDIQYTNYIQPSGVLICLDRDSKEILSASTNFRVVSELSSLAPGQELRAVWPELAVCGGDGAFMIGDDYLVHRHSDGRTTYCEIEPCQVSDRSGAQHLIDLGGVLIQLNNAGTLEMVTERAAAEIRRITGMERVLIYRFDREGHGAVIAESKVEDWPESFIGYHFPSADIPLQARALYLISPCRFVERRDYQPVPVVPALDPRSGEPFDLGRCRLRSVSPMHRLYQENLGVDGAMSISIIHEGGLWGLVVGHHRRPHRVSIPAREQVLAVTTCLSMRVAATESAEERSARSWHAIVHAKLLEQIAGADEFVTPLIKGDVTLADIFFASGGAVVACREQTEGDDGENYETFTVGRAPDHRSLVALGRVCRERLVDGVFETDHISSILPGFAAFAEHASGVLAISVGDAGRHLIMWFRPESVRTITWGGATPDQVRRDKYAGNYLPRKSFDRWIEEHREHSQSWQSWQIDIARSLRSALNDVILRQMRTIRNLNDHLEECNRAKSRFLAHMSHELRAPLNTVLGFSELLSSGECGVLTEAQLQDVGYIHEASTHLLHLINDVLDLSKVEAGKLDLQLETVDLSALAARVIALQVGLARAHGVTIESRHAADLPLLMIDERLTRQMLFNLLSNALKFTPKGGVITVTTLRRPDGGVTLTVADTGIGIPLARQDRILEPFGQAHEDMMISHVGTGLGLPIVKSLIELHGGRLTLVSREGEGTSFSLHFPAAASLP
ncbi:MAG: ATP-binding protein [Rhodospirillaceae bacterium]